MVTGMIEFQNARACLTDAAGLSLSMKAASSRRPSRWSVLVFLLFLSLCLISVAAQTPATNRPVARPRVPQAMVAPAMPASAANPLISLMMQQPNIDTDSPVVAVSEFDPPSVTRGGRVIYRVILTAMNESVKFPEKLPAPAGLELIPGGRGQSYSPPMPKMQPRTTILFHANPAASGTYVMPAFTATVYGKPVTIPEARLTVVEPGSTPTREAPRLLIELPEGDLYVGQNLPVRVLLPDRGDGLVQGLSQAQLLGEAFLVDMSFMRQRRDVITRNGQAIPVWIVEMAVIPLKEGQHPLMAQGQMIVNPPTALPGRPVFYIPLIDSDSLTVTVKSVPKDGQLPGFTGAIGSFQLDPSKLSAGEVRAGDPVTLSVQVKGEGNLSRFGLPRLASTRDWQAFPPMSDGTLALQTQFQGFRVFTYTLIPLSDRVKATPPIPFSYFDPKRKAYVDLTVSPMPIKVTPAPGGTIARPPPPSRGAAPDIDDPSRGEREWVLTGLSESPGSPVFNLVPVQQRLEFLWLQILPAVGLGGLWFWDRRRRFLEQHPEVVLKRRARRGLRRQLRLMTKAVAAKDAAAYVTAAVHALREVSAPRTAANPEALVGNDVCQALPPPARQSREGELVRALFAAADRLRFNQQPPEAATLFAMQPEVDRLLAKLKEQL